MLKLFTVILLLVFLIAMPRKTIVTTNLNFIIIHELSHWTPKC